MGAHHCFYCPVIIQRRDHKNIKYADKVIINPGKNVHLSRSIKLIKPDILPKGGDRIRGGMPEFELSVRKKKLGCKIVYNVSEAKCNYTHGY